MIVIQNKIFGDEQNRMIEVLSKLNQPFCVVENFSQTSGMYPTLARGSVQFVNELNKFNLESFNYHRYIRYIDTKHLLNNDFVIIPWYNLGKVFNYFPNSDSLFIRPNSGMKIFTGTTIGRKWTDKELEIIRELPNSQISSNDMVIVSSAKKIISEYRVLVYKGEILDCSVYDGEENFDKYKIFEFVSSACDIKTKNYDFLAIDVAETENGLKIIEWNYGYSSGWYDTDYEKVFKVLMNL